MYPLVLLGCNMEDIFAFKTIFMKTIIQFPFKKCVDKLLTYICDMHLF